MGRVRAGQSKEDKLALSSAKGGEPSEPLSRLVDGYGYWSLTLPLQGCGGMQVKLQVMGPRGRKAERTHPACEVKPVPTVALAEEGSKRLFLPLIRRGR
jgi:hypothetical protein